MSFIKRNKEAKRYFCQEVLYDDCYMVYIVDEATKTYVVKTVTPGVCVDETVRGEILDLDAFYDRIEQYLFVEEMLPHEYPCLVSGNWYKLPRNKKD